MIVPSNPEDISDTLWRLPSSWCQHSIRYRSQIIIITLTIS